MGAEDGSVVSHKLDLASERYNKFFTFGIFEKIPNEIKHSETFYIKI